ncbi:MAG: alpha/beta hydrolase, partial [Clostridia bacterium]
MQDVTHVDWQGYDACRFDVDGRESFLVCPHQAALGNPWVWRAEFFGAFDAADRALLAQGWHLAYHKASDMYGCTQAVAYFSAFQDVVEQR